MSHRINVNTASGRTGPFAGAQINNCNFNDANGNNVHVDQNGNAFLNGQNQGPFDGANFMGANFMGNGFMGNGFMGNDFMGNGFMGNGFPAGGGTNIDNSRVINNVVHNTGAGAGSINTVINNGHNPNGMRMTNTTVNNGGGASSTHVS